MRGAQTIRYLFTADSTLIIRGPASFQLLSGSASILGARIRTKSRIVIRQEKQLPIETETEADLEILLGDMGKISEVAGSTIPNSWRAAVEALAQIEHGKVMVIGSSDVGKSTLCTYLSNSLLKEVTRVRIIDGDTGQADIGPPTAIGSAFPTSPINSLTDLDPDVLLFIGDTTPSRVESKLIEGIHRLCTINQEEDQLIIIDTDGWALDPQAFLYKRRLIETIEPDLIIGISTSNELQPILKGSKAGYLQVRPPDQVLQRTRNDRRHLRTMQYRKFLDGGTIKTLPIRDVLLKGLISPQNSQYAEYAGLVAGLLDGHGLMLEIGVTMNLDQESLKVYTRSVENVREVEFGQVRLTTDGVEVGYLQY